MEYNMVPRLDDDVIEQIQIKDIHPHFLSKEQKLLIEKLIPDEKIREQYIKYGFCRECHRPNTGFTNGSTWCQPCNSKHFQDDFDKWTSGNKEIDKFIQSFQLNATRMQEVLEWIPYDRITNIEFLAEGG